MPVQVSYPGVYVQEVASGSRTISGVATSIPLFIGMADQGPMDTATRIQGYADFQRKFGATNLKGELHDQVKQFFQNGGSTAWVMRIANGAASAEVELENEAGARVLRLLARSAGLVGATIRATVDYDTKEPEASFNLLIEQTNTEGSTTTIVASELFKAVDMNPNSGKFVIDVLEQQSALVRGELITATIPAADNAYSLWGGVWETADGNVAAFNTALGALGDFQISVDGSPFRLVSITGPVANTAAVTLAINTALGPVGKQVSIDYVQVGSATQWAWRIRSVDSGGLITFAKSGTDNDICESMQMGTAFGGIDVGGHALRRPAANGIFGLLRVDTPALLGTNLGGILNLTASEITDLTITDSQGGDTIGSLTLPTVEPTSFLGGRAAIDEIAATINTNFANWTAVRHGYRLVLRPNFGGASADATAYLATGVLAIDGDYLWTTGTGNVRNYQLGGYGSTQGSFHHGTEAGNDGLTPELPNYEAAYVIAKRDIDIFNMLILPLADDQGDGDRALLWGPASVFAKSERAILLMDPPAAWATADDVVDPTTGVASLRTGVVTDHTALYWPRIQVAGDSGLKTIDPAGAMAGIMARTDGARGVWKAPAGLEANLYGVRGVAHGMSDGENGLINPQAVNAIRAFPNGIVSWGARTMVGFDNSGNDDYKYLPVRRFALFIQESLYRGLQWAVFEPNDEPLWRQMATTAGAFMNTLFRQGAFAGKKSSDAYFIKVDRETTTQTDINLGIVNVVIGFAPLKPAEFVVITLQQKAGEVQV